MKRLDVKQQCEILKMDLIFVCCSSQISSSLFLASSCFKVKTMAVQSQEMKLGIKYR